MPDGSQPKFYLGHDKEEAVRRLNRITALWETIEDPHSSRRWQRAWHHWDRPNLEIARALAKGNVPVLEKGDYEPPERYHQRVNILQEMLGAAEPANPILYDVGRQDILDNISEARSKLSGGSKLREPTGQTFHQALDAYRSYIDREYRDADGTISDNGKTKQTQIKAIKGYLLDVDLAALDYLGADELFGVFRRRPASKRYGTPMARKSCTNYIGELGRFFRWLHLSSHFHWRKPEDFDLIRRTPRELDEDTEKEAREVPVWTIDQLAVLNGYATPIERIFVTVQLPCIP